ncbi:MAG: dethiobiotin synthase [Myxococcales bacterium]|nr:dethiobiotin synthase [Myxococcales bacterium]
MTGGFFVAGTDTGVGKTEIARALCTLLAPVRALKPVETGCEDLQKPADALALLAACGSGQSLDDVCPYRFRLPAAPLVAAEAEGRVIDIERILALSSERPIVVEPAGGLLVPLTRAPLSLEEIDPPDRAPAEVIVTNLDLAERLALPVVLVARAGLGTLNHCALSVAALEARGLAVAAIVLNRVTPQDDPSVASNPRWVHELTGALVLGPTPFVRDPASRPRALAPFVDSLVGRQ